MVKLAVLHLIYEVLNHCIYFVYRYTISCQSIVVGFPLRFGSRLLVPTRPVPRYSIRQPQLVSIFIRLRTQQSPAQGSPGEHTKKNCHADELFC